MYDRTGWKTSILTHFLIETCGLGLVLFEWYMNKNNDISFLVRVVLWHISGGLFGISDSAFNSLINVCPLSLSPLFLSLIRCVVQETLIELFPREVESAYAYYNFVYCIGFSAQSAVAIVYLDTGIAPLTLVAFGWLVIGTLGFIILRCTTQPEHEATAEQAASD